MADNAKTDNDNAKWGMIIAGAATVAGAVVLAPTLLPSLADSAGDVGSWIADKVTGKGIEAGTATAMEKLGEALTSETARNIAGATLLGGGAAYMMTHKGAQKTDEFDDVAETQDTQGFAMREDMKRMQAIMQARMSVASPEHMQQMAAPGRA